MPVDQVKLTNYVVDYTSTLSAQEIQIISNIAQALQENNAAELAVVIVDDFDGLTKEEFALEVAHNKLGDADSDNGLLVLIGLEVKEYRVEVGYGLEGVLNDAKIGRMSKDLLVPAFQEGAYGQGIALLVQAIGSEILPEGIPAPKQYEPTRSKGISSYFMFMIIFIIFRAINYIRYSKKNYKHPKDRDVNNALSAAVIASMFLRPPQGGLGGGGLGGGFGGFGGGGFGGGGAGGGW